MLALKRRQIETPWKMAPVRLVFVWFLLTVRMGASAVYLEAEEQGKLLVGKLCSTSVKGHSHWRTLTIN